jgi:Cu/Ag efflux protein CusF
MKAVLLTVLMLLSVVAQVRAQAGASLPATPVAEMSLTEGEVRRIDKEAGKLTLKHGQIDHLGMPPMTMVFRAADPKMLDGLAEGDKVRFAAERVGGAITVTHLEAVQ